MGRIPIPPPLAIARKWAELLLVRSAIASSASLVPRIKGRRCDATNLAQIEHEEPLSTSSVAHFLMLAQAVAAGAGAALLPSFLIEPELQAGSMIIPFELPLIEARSYYLVYPEENIERSAVRQVRDFICDEARSLDNDRASKKPAEQAAQDS